MNTTKWLFPPHLLPHDHHPKQRAKAARFIQDCCAELELKNRVVHTAIVYVARFYTRWGWEEYPAVVGTYIQGGVVGRMGMM